MTKDELLKARTDAMLGMSRDLDAYRLKVFGSIGSGINCSQFDLVIICRLCGELAHPLSHACRAKLNETQHSDG